MCPRIYKKDETRCSAISILIQTDICKLSYINRFLKHKHTKNKFLHYGHIKRS
jgi:hypothetical protein